jgi:hypothetical protein
MLFLLAGKNRGIKGCGKASAGIDVLHARSSRRISVPFNFITVLRPRRIAAVGILVAAITPGSAGSAAHAANGGTETPFLAENDQAMTRMMDGMSIKPSSDVDRDLAAMMIPHHQGAIDMAQAELRYGHSEQSRRDQPSRPRLCGRTVLEYGLRHGSAGGFFLGVAMFV